MVDCRDMLRAGVLKLPRLNKDCNCLVFVPVALTLVRGTAEPRFSRSKRISTVLAERAAT